MAVDDSETTDATTEDAETTDEATPSHKRAKVVVGKAGGIDRYDCSAGDFVTYKDAEAVEEHIASAR